MKIDAQYKPHDGVTEWADCLDCGAHLDPATDAKAPSPWDGSCYHCGAPAERVGLLADATVEDVRHACGGCGREVTTEANVCNERGAQMESGATLCRYDNSSALRSATAEELAASIEAAECDGGAGVITVEVDGEQVDCYVQD